MSTMSGRPSSTLAHAAAFAVASRPATGQARTRPSRAEAIADYRIWEQSGLAALLRHAPEGQADTTSDQHQRAHAEYMRLRHSTEFAALVQEIERTSTLTAGQWADEDLAGDEAS
ncbi:hypothetical protein [Roseateles sp. P5_E11]